MAACAPMHGSCPDPPRAGQAAGATAGTCTLRLECLLLVLALAGCGGGGSTGDEVLDLGGGVSMTADGQILLAGKAAGAS